MPTDRARKQHVRDHMLPGENYTTALRRLAEAPRWELDGQGLGTTEYRAEIDGHEAVVAFAGDHRRPWLGWWFLAEDDAPHAPGPDTDDDEDDDPAARVGGRYRFTVAFPDDDTVEEALVTITEVIRQARTGTVPDAVSAEHGPDAGADLAEDAPYFVAWDGTEEWAVTCLAPTHPADWQLEDETGGDLTWTETPTRTGWVDADGSPVTVYQL